MKRASKINKYIVIEPGDLWDVLAFDGDIIKTVKHILTSGEKDQTLVVREGKGKVALYMFISDLFKSYLKIDKTWYYYDNFKLKKVKL